MKDLARSSNIQRQEKERRTPLSGSFLDILNKRKLQLSRALLLDTSGSMTGQTFIGGTRISALRAVVSDLPLNLSRYAFNDDCRLVVDVPSPCGSTRLGTAFQKVKADGIQHVILITDGEPTEPESFILSEAVGLKIDIFYVGESEEPPEILKKLANQCNGSFGTADLERDREELVEAVIKLIGDGK